MDELMDRWMVDEWRVDPVAHLDRHFAKQLNSSVDLPVETKL